MWSMNILRKLTVVPKRGIFTQTWAQKLVHSQSNNPLLVFAWNFVKVPHVNKIDNKEWKTWENSF